MKNNNKTSVIVVHIDSQHDTSVMKAMYEGLADVTLLYNPTRLELEDALEKNPTADLITIGHGNAHGLFSRDWSGYVIDGANADLLRGRERVVCVWCWAADFARRNQLRGFFTSMFISNPEEAIMYGKDRRPVEVFDQQNLWLCDEVKSMWNGKTPMNEWVERLRSRCDNSLDFVRYNYEGVTYLNG
jgi:hypothetical protein